MFSGYSSAHAGGWANKGSKPSHLGFGGAMISWGGLWMFVGGFRVGGGLGDLFSSNEGVGLGTSSSG
jgi:hypothetical protein